VFLDICVPFDVMPNFNPNPVMSIVEKTSAGQPESDFRGIINFAPHIISLTNTGNLTLREVMNVTGVNGTACAMIEEQ
jgi:hypothetical protein